MKLHSCFFGHEWSQWKQTEKGALTRGGAEKKEIGNYLVQERSCNKCGFKQLNHQKVIVI